MENQLIVSNLSDIKEILRDIVKEEVNSHLMVSAKEVMSNAGIKTIETFRSACKRNDVDTFGIGKRLCIKKSDYEKIFKKIN